MKRATWMWAATAALALGLAGCGGFDELEFTLRSTPPDNRVSIGFHEIRIPEAIAVGVIARPMDGGDQMDEDTKVALQSKNPAILDVGPTAPISVQADGTSAAWGFVIFGVSAGTTEVTVRIDDELEAQIPATVLQQ